MCGLAISVGALFTLVRFLTWRLAINNRAIGVLVTMIDDMIFKDLCVFHSTGSHERLMSDDVQLMSDDEQRVVGRHE